MKILPKKQTVKRLLEKKPHLQDSDSKLIASVWWLELIKLGVDPKPHRELLELFAGGKLSKVESITRARRKLQEIEPSLRGKNYQDRQKNTQSIKEELRNF